MRILAAASLGVLLAGAGFVGVQAVAQAPAAADSALPQGPGRDTMVRVCSGCHAPELVASKKLDAQGWYDLVQFMADRGAVATDAEMNEIISYLATSFPKDAAAAAAPAPAGAATAGASAS